MLFLRFIVVWWKMFGYFAAFVVVLMLSPFVFLHFFVLAKPHYVRFCGMYVYVYTYWLCCASTNSDSYSLEISCEGHLTITGRSPVCILLSIRLIDLSMAARLFPFWYFFFNFFFHSRYHAIQSWIWIILNRMDFLRISTVNTTQLNAFLSFSSGLDVYKLMNNNEKRRKIFKCPYTKLKNLIEIWKN